VIPQHPEVVGFRVIESSINFPVFNEPSHQIVPEMDVPVPICRFDPMFKLISIRNGWESLKKQARVENLQLKDLRTYFNHILKTNYNFTSKEAGAYIGNNEVVNELHYSPYHESTIREKMRKLPLKEALGGS